MMISGCGKRILLSRKIQVLLKTTSTRPCGCGRFFSSYNNNNDDNDDTRRRSSSRLRTALVVGSSGALGSSVSQYLSQKLDMQVIGADILELPPELTPDHELDAFIPLNHRSSSSSSSNDLVTLTTDLIQGVHSVLQSDNDNDNESGLDAIICASGGWQGDPPAIVPKDNNNNNNNTISEADLLHGAESYARTMQTMMQQNIHPVLAAGFVAQYCTNPNALMVVMGATAALSPTPGMVGYGMAKAAAHHYVHTIGACTGTGSTVFPKSIRKAGRSVRQHIPSLDTLTIVGILPTTLDTLNNRKYRPNQNYNEWTKPIDIAAEIGVWINTPALRPHSGSLVKVHTDGSTGRSVFELVR